MNRKGNLGLYVGMILVLIGAIFFLNLNGLLPEGYTNQIINIIVGIIIFICYLKNKKLSTLMFSSFFLINGVLLIGESLLPGYNYLAAGLLIPGLMLIIAYIARRDSVYLIPGAMLTSMGCYVLLITIGLISGFSSIIGMFFICLGIGFLVIFIGVHGEWAGLTGFILGSIGLIITLLGLGSVSRYLVLNVVAIGIVLFGVILVIKHYLNNEDEGKRGE